MIKMTFKDWLNKNNAPSDMVEWAGGRTLEQACEECERGDWLFWLAQEAGVEERLLILARVRCARLVEHLMTDLRSLSALDVAESFAQGAATGDELDDSASVAYAAYAAATSAASASAAFAAFTISYVAVGFTISYVADAASYAATVNADAVRNETLKECADIIRETIGLNLMKEGVNYDI